MKRYAIEKDGIDLYKVVDTHKLNYYGKHAIVRKRLGYATAKAIIDQLNSK